MSGLDVQYYVREPMRKPTVGDEDADSSSDEEIFYDVGDHTGRDPVVANQPQAEVAETSAFDEDEELRKDFEKMEAELRLMKAEHSDTGVIHSDSTTSSDVEPRALVSTEACLWPYAQYFELSEAEMAADPRTAACRQQLTPTPTCKRNSHNFKAQLWMTQEFPMEINELLPLLETLAPTSCVKT
eukprot:SAG31_NODE_8830_length_1379_cov_1.664062_1_plen_185_part_00